MSAEKVDRRVSRTRRQLRDALQTLILEKGFDGITIEEITDRADVGRTTFYLHYKDKEELLLECINLGLSDLIAQVSDVPLSDWSLSDGRRGTITAPNAAILLIFQHAAKNVDLYRIILRGAGSGETQNRVREIYASAVNTFLVEKVNREAIVLEPRVPLDVFSNYFAGSLLGLMSWWLEEEMPYSPEKMTEMYQQMFFPGAGEVLGISFP